MKTTTHCNEYAQVSRRSFLTSGMQAAAAMFVGPRLLAMPDWMPRIKLANPHVGPRGDTLVCIFLRGGADGLNMVIPHGDDTYYALRPTLAIPRPDGLSVSAKTVDLDGFFGLHPALAPLSNIYQAGDMAFVQATGSPDETRSHFEAMDLMERGVTQNGDYTGWLARHLGTLDTGNDSALRAVGIGEMLPAALTGTVSATALQAIADYHLQGREERLGDMQALLASLYNQQDDLLTAVAQQTFAAIDVLSKIDTQQQSNGKLYPEREFGKAMQTVAQLIKADVGLEVACVDLVGWDTHVAQGSIDGPMPSLMAQLSAGLAAFYEDLQPMMGNITLVVMSEFGRRAHENGGLGTDHGHGNMMMVLGGGINGNRVFADWPGLQPEQLTGPGDLSITIDYRDILGELLRKRLNNNQIAEIFPGYSVTEIGLAVPRVRSQTTFDKNEPARLDRLPNSKVINGQAPRAS